MNSSHAHAHHCSTEAPNHLRAESENKNKHRLLHTTCFELRLLRAMTSLRYFHFFCALLCAIRSAERRKARARMYSERTSHAFHSS